MARRSTPHPTDGELEILQVLWDHGPSSLGAICGAIRRQRQVATTTVATVLKVMLEKGLVERSGEVRGATWSAKISRENAASGLVRKLLDRVFDGSARRLVAHVLEDEKLTPEDRAELRRILEQDSPKPRKRENRR